MRTLSLRLSISLCVVAATLVPAWSAPATTITVPSTLARSVHLRYREALGEDPNLQLIPREGFNVFFVGLNNTHPPFNNEKVRQAIDYVRTNLSDDWSKVTIATDGSSVYACTSDEEVIDLVVPDE